MRGDVYAVTTARSSSAMSIFFIRNHIRRSYTNLVFVMVQFLEVVDSKRRDGRVVEGARLESETGDAYQGTPKHLAA
jgi:hypothetical protein